MDSSIQDIADKLVSESELVPIARQAQKPLVVSHNFGTMVTTSSTKMDTGILTDRL